MATDDWASAAADLNTLAVDLLQAGPRAQVRAGLAVRRTAFAIEATAKQLVPVDTGNLKNSIGSSPIGQDRALGPGDLDAEIGPTADYAEYVEFGTSQHGPAAFMGPAFDRHAGDLEKALGQAAEDLT